MTNLGPLISSTARDFCFRRIIHEHHRCRRPYRRDQIADIRKYLAEPYNKRGGPLLPSDGLDTNLGGLVGGLEQVDIPTRLSDMDKEGIDVSVLFPTSSFAVNGMVERDYAVAYARAYNDFIAEVCKQSPRLKGYRVGAVAGSQSSGRRSQPRRHQARARVDRGRYSRHEGTSGSEDILAAL